MGWSQCPFASMVQIRDYGAVEGGAVQQHRGKRAAFAGIAGLAATAAVAVVVISSGAPSAHRAVMLDNYPTTDLGILGVMVSPRSISMPMPLLGRS